MCASVKVCGRTSNEFNECTTIKPTLSSLVLDIYDQIFARQDEKILAVAYVCVFDLDYETIKRERQPANFAIMLC